MECIKILKQLNENRLKGHNWLKIKDLTEREIQEIIECGYFIKKIKNGYKISDT